jgi:hypothetical protein
MEHIGIDPHKNQRQMRLLTAAGEVIHRRMTTVRSRFTAGFGD